MWPGLREACTREGGGNLTSDSIQVGVALWSRAINQNQDSPIDLQRVSLDLGPRPEGQ